MTTVLDKFRLGDRVALVTGASSGLGVAVAVGLDPAGADLVLAARRADRLTATADLVRAEGRRARCGRPDAPERVLPDLLAEHVRILCANAGDVTVSYESLRFLTPGHRAALVAERDRYENGLGRLIDGCRGAGGIDPAPTAVLAKVGLGIVNWPYQWYRPDGSLPVAELAELLAGRAVAALHVHPA